MKLFFGSLICLTALSTLVSVFDYFSAADGNFGSVYFPALLICFLLSLYFEFNRCQLLKYILYTSLALNSLYLIIFLLQQLQFIQVFPNGPHSDFGSLVFIGILSTLFYFAHKKSSNRYSEKTQYLKN